MGIKPELVDVIVLAWPKAEKEDELALKEALEAEGYTFDGPGIKAFLADVLFEEDEDEDESVEESPGAQLGKLLVGAALQFTQQHPEKLAAAKARAAAFRDKLRARFRGQ